MKRLFGKIKGLELRTEVDNLTISKILMGIVKQGKIITHSSIVDFFGPEDHTEVARVGVIIDKTCSLLVQEESFDCASRLYGVMAAGRKEDHTLYVIPSDKKLKYMRLSIFYTELFNFTHTSMHQQHLF